MQAIWTWEQRMEPCLRPQSGRVVDDRDGFVHPSMSSSGPSDVSIASVALSSPYFGEHATSPTPSNQSARSPLFEMSSIMKHLPIKRGLSMHYQGKSQSFTSLSNVKCLEDLAKQDRCQKKKLKTCKSDRGELGNHRSSSHKASSGTISKRTAKDFSSMDSKSNGRFFGSSFKFPTEELVATILEPLCLMARQES